MITLITNVLDATHLAFLAPLMTASGVSEERAREVGAFRAVGGTLHERGHVDGDHNPIFGTYATSLEETNAQGSVFILATRYGIPIDLLATFEACFTPVKRAQAGSTTPHSHGDMVLFNAYLNAGALKIVEVDGKPHIEVADEEALVITAFEMTTKVRLWEKGIPLAQQRFLEEFNPKDMAQDDRIIGNAMNWLEGLPEKTRAKYLKQAIGEVQQFYSNDRIQAIGKTLQPIVDALPAKNILPLVPTKDAYKYLVA